MVKKVFMVPIRLYSYSTNSNKNNILISQFIKLKTNQSDVYKKKAYQNAINILKLFPLSLTSAEEIKRVPGSLR
ncbi:hypothetical protein HK099_007489 [Clydaea vesicula]|uniref:Uncharacterized protein n=1 Tax=Clydaea vesicula TaxID=447962 RepID=A0AAD5U9G3_9FUNG|nr:hypothetical protein HK099_007489 [Clydaea vesicula]